MDSLFKIIEILVWPITIIVVVTILRSPLSSLLPNLKKLKYKDLELEFEKEAKGILAEAERDLPAPEKIESLGLGDSGTRFSLGSLDPAVEILSSWRQLELKLRELCGHEFYMYSTRNLVRELVLQGKISKETSRIILDLSSLRNKVAHSNEEQITPGTATFFNGSIARVLTVLEPRDA